MERLQKGTGRVSNKTIRKYSNPGACGTNSTRQSRLTGPRESTFTLEHVIRRASIAAGATSKTKKYNMPNSHMLYFLINKSVYVSEMATPT
nr:hypothetical protein [Tanacetum cinerariifolium]